MLSSPHSDGTGVTFLNGRYRLGEGRWEGAVGVVREAYDTLAHDRRVVIKHPDPYQGPEVRAHKERLLDVEAKALSVLRGLPHICAMLDQGRVGKGPGSFRYLVIDWARGDPVAEMVQQAAAEGRALPIGTVLLMLSQLARVLAEAHGKGLINNDIDIKHLYWSDAERNLVVIDWGNAKTESSPDWGRFGYRDDLEQFADVMFCLLTGQSSLDVKHADLAFWQDALSDTLDVIRNDLALIGSRASSAEGGYRHGGELYHDLSACLGKLREYLDGHLTTVDALLAEPDPEPIAEAERLLRGLCEIAPADEGVVRRLEDLSRTRRLRQESASLQLGCAYVKAESWLDAIEILSRTFGHHARPDSPAALLLGAAKLIDFRGASASAEATRHWAAAAKAIAERRYEDALDSYLAVPEEWLDTRAEPVRTLLSMTGRYILRHEVRRVAEALRSAWRAEGDPGDNSHRAPDPQRKDRLGMLYHSVTQALAALASCAGSDWMGQRHAYAGIARALEACRGHDLPSALARDAEEVALKAREVVGLMEGAERALERLDLGAAAEAMESVPRSDPDNEAAPQHAEAIRGLVPAFERIQTFEGWGTDDWSQLEQSVLGAVESAFASLPGSSLQPLIARLVHASVGATAVRRDAERLEHGLRLLEEGKWHAARQWAGRLLKAHPDWIPAGYVSCLAKAYLAFYEFRGPPKKALERVSAALETLDELDYRHDELTRHRKRLEAIHECCQHLFDGEDGRPALARAAIENLPEQDPHRRVVLRGIATMNELGTAVEERRWDDAAEAARRLRAVRMSILSNVTARWDRVFPLMAEAEVLWHGGQLEEARDRLEKAKRLIDTAGSGWPLISAKDVQADVSRLQKELAEQRAALEAADENGDRERVVAEQPIPAPEPPMASVEEGSERRPDEVGRSVWSGMAAFGHTLGRHRRTMGHRLAGRLCSRYDATMERLRSLRAGRGSGTSEPATGRTPQDGDPSSVVSTKLASGGRAARLTKEPLEGLGWTLGGAAVVGIIAVVLILLAAQEAAHGSSSNVRGSSSVEQGFARVQELIEAHDRESAAYLIEDLQARHGESLTAEQRATLLDLEDCLWLSGDPEAVVPDRLAEDWQRLDRLWAETQADGGQGLAERCPLFGPPQGVIEAAVRSRCAHVQALMEQHTVDAYRAVAGALEGLEESGMGALCGDAGFLREALITAQVALARHWLGSGVCDEGRAALARAVELARGDPREVVSQEMARLTALADACDGLEACCEAAARLVQVGDPDTLGDELLTLADLRDTCPGMDRACPSTGLPMLLAGRLDALRQLIAQEQFAQAIDQGLKLANDRWFTAPPVEGGEAIGEIVADAHIGWIRQTCIVEDCGAGYAQVIEGARTFLQEHGGGLSPDRRAQLVGLVEMARASCPYDAPPHGTSADAPGASAVSVSLFDPTPGAWSGHGMYYGDTADGRAWHLNDVFVKRQVEPVVYRDVTSGQSHPLYTTDYRPTGFPAGRIASLRLRGKVVSIKGTVDGPRPLWGAQVPGSGSAAIYVLAVWEPSSGVGHWSLRVWSPGDEQNRVVDLADGPADLIAELRIVSDPGAYYVYWQDELVLAGQPLSASHEVAPVRLVIGEGVHVWIQDTEAVIISDAGGSSSGEKTG